MSELVADDKLLVARVVAANDTVAFGELVRRHQSQVRNALRRLTGDFSLADDLAQDCFLHAWDRIHGYSGRGSFIGWLLKIAYTTFLQSRRKSKRYVEVVQQVADEAGTAAAADSAELPDVERFLAVLSEEERAIMVFSYACGLSHREIGEAVGMPVGTVKSVIHRAKQRIRAEFEIEDHQHG